MRYVNKVSMAGIAKVFVAATIFLTAALTNLSYGGHFTLAFQRKLGAWENSGEAGSCGGGRATRVWIWDENGNPVPNIDLYTTWDVLMGTTDTDGRCQVNYNIEIGFDLVCVDGIGSTSDVARLMSSEFEPCQDLHSFEVGYLYKTDISNPGTFDTDLHCTWPEMYGYNDEVAYTNSLAYNGVDCTDLMSDQSYWGNWQVPPSYFGQTFVATGDRVVAARVHGVIGGLDLLSWNLQIVSFPSLQSVGPPTSVPVRWPFGWEAFWGVDDCPVVPGRTYMLKAWRDGDGMNIYHVTQDVYPDGQYYEGTTAYPGFDLSGHVCCMNYNPLPDYDFNKDGRTDFRDICILAKFWSGYDPSVDIAPPPSGDGRVNRKDLAVVIGNWLTATTIPPLPNWASNPNPVYGAMNIDKNADLSWAAGEGATSYDVYFGTSSPPPFIGNQTTTTFDPGTMAYSTKYYWRIDSVNGWGTTAGEEWMFSTGMPGPP